MRKSVEESLTQYLYAELKNDLNTQNWRAADEQTYRLMLNIAKRENYEYLDLNNINSFSCPDLRKIDQLWVTKSNKRFGFSVQKQIWIQTGNRLGIKPEDYSSEDEKNYLRFAKTVGWYNDKATGDSRGAFVSSYNELLERINNYPRTRGSLPSVVDVRNSSIFRENTSSLALRLVNCNI